MYGRGEGEQRLGQVRLRNQLFLLACTSECNSSFAALATRRKVMCGCLHAHCVNLRYNFCPWANVCKMKTQQILT